MSPTERALNIIRDYGATDGDWHKQWVLDQVVRALTETDVAYQAWVIAHNDGVDGPDTYHWETGVAP